MVAEVVGPLRLTPHALRGKSKGAVVIGSPSRLTKEERGGE
jgi:hypothetical protein